MTQEDLSAKLDALEFAVQKLAQHVFAAKAKKEQEKTAKKEEPAEPTTKQSSGPGPEQFKDCPMCHGAATIREGTTWCPECNGTGEVRDHDAEQATKEVADAKATLAQHGAK